jgi:hypothetical protein
MVNDAIVAMREYVGKGAVDLRCDSLEGQHSALDLAGCKRSAHGRIVRVRTVASVNVGDVRLPRGTTLEFNDSKYIDPRAPDLLHTARLNLPGKLRAGLYGIPQTQLTFYANGALRTVNGAARGELIFKRMQVTAEHKMHYTQTGELVEGTLAAPFVCGDMQLPAATRFQQRALTHLSGLRMFNIHSKHAGGYRFILAQSMRLPDLQLEPGDVLLTNALCTEFTGLLSSRALQISNQFVEPKFIALPLAPNGSVARGHRLQHYLAVAADIRKANYGK